jgi:two-component system cell cycle response regulator
MTAAGSGGGGSTEGQGRTQAAARVPEAPTRPRVLVVEDSPAQAEHLADVLTGEGLEVQIAGHAAEAIRRVRADPPDLVLLDMILPDMNGLEVLRIIKARPDEQFIPVILLSVRSDLDSRVAGLRMGADDFLAKPYAEAEVRARAGAMLRIKSLQDQLRAAKRECERLSVTDGLTGLYNRRHFGERLREEFSRSQRYGAPLSLIMLDLDHFKALNDRYGHPFGDRVLRETAELMSTSIRDHDICARYGGEEFTIVLPSTNLQGAAAVAERCLTRMRDKTYRTGADAGRPEEEVRVTASIGVACHPSSGVRSPEHLVELADRALYRAKAEGRNTIRLALPVDSA